MLSSAQVQLAALKLEDLEAVTQITSQVAFAQAWSPEKLRAELGEAQSLGLFADSGSADSFGEPRTALAAFIFYRRLGSTGEVLEISWLATAPSWQRQGCMAKLLGALANASSQVREIWLEVHEGNRDARNLYEKIGFKVTARRPRYYADGGAALLMSWKLS